MIQYQVFYKKCPCFYYGKDIFMVEILSFLCASIQKRKAFTLLRGNSRDCKGFSCLMEISCSVLLYQILSHLSSFIVRDSATDFDITDSSPTPGSLLPSASLPPYWQLSLFCKCQPGHGMGQNRILCGYLLKILFS